MGYSLVRLTSAEGREKAPILWDKGRTGAWVLGEEEVSRDAHRDGWTDLPALKTSLNLAMILRRGEMWQLRDASRSSY